ncbi:hypothetical protein PoB_004405500 [Plakobranchus ocellatus]|uniref:Uncharacterized protein n=1 Tax=Plakobranchus ocellatus TaxID=259542 RepID=A0AAV4BEK5_9GAST|nr:hypothetical protein PoB_004405500 [Plakobranchus ocellatus]
MPEEDFSTVLNRLIRLYDGWLLAAKVEPGNYKHLFEFMPMNQVYSCCNSNLVMFLKENAPKSVEEFRRLGELFESSHPEAQPARNTLLTAAAANNATDLLKASHRSAH